MIARVEQQQVETGTPQRYRQRHHQFGITAPAMQQYQGALGAGRRQPPAIESPATQGGNPGFLKDQPMVGRRAGFTNPGRAKTQMYPQRQG